MKHHSLFTLVLSFLSTLWMVSCTLIDNDLRELHDMPGYDNVVHIEDENMTCDYQYQDNTIVMDQRYEPYIHRMDYENHKLYMYDYTPEEMLPKVGQPLISPQNAKLEWGIMHTPTKITREGNLYVFELERTTIDNAFKVFDLDGEWDIMKETEYDVNLDDTTYTEVSNHARTTRASDGFENYDGDWHEVDILPIVGVIAGLAIVDENKRDQVADKALLSLGANWNFTWPRNVERDKKTGALKKGKDGFAVAVSATGSFRIRWKTLCKVKKILKKDGRKVEVVANVGSQIEIIPQITGKLELTADFFNILKLPNPKFGPLPGPLPVYVILEPSFDFSVSLEGTVGYKWIKTFRTEFAAYNNISGKKDGVSVKNDNKPIKKEAMNEINKWSGNSEANLKINMEAGAGLTARVVFGSPEEYPNVGLSLGFHFGARFKTVLDKNQSAYDNHIRFSLPLKLSGKFFLNIWDGFTFDWNFADAIAKLTGKEEGAEWEFAKTDFRVFPSIDNMSIFCTNKDELFTVPRFDINFTVLDQGMKLWENIRPVLKIYLHDDADALLVIDNKEPSTDPKNYSWTLDDFRIIRGQYYDAEVCWVEKKDEYEYDTPASLDDVSPPKKTGKTYDKVLCSKRYTFSTESPTVVIDDMTITMQKWCFSELKVVKSGNDWINDSYYDYRFRTHQTFTGLDNIAKWGFMINKKNYEVNATPQSNLVAVVWKMKRQKNKRVFTIAPYIIPKKGVDVRVFGPSKKITINYDEELNEYNNVREKIGDRWYKTSGFDWEEEFKQSTDYVMDDFIKSRQSNYNENSGRSDVSNSIDNNSHVIVFEIDE